jgi:hypothetical protein
VNIARMNIEFLIALLFALLWTAGYLCAGLAHGKEPRGVLLRDTGITLMLQLLFWFGAITLYVRTHG